MTTFKRSSDGRVLVKGQKYEMLVGTRAQVWHGTSFKTTGGLKKSDLLQNKNGRIVSRAKHATAKKEKRLVKAGYGTKKGKFGFVLLNNASRSRGKSRGKSRGRSRKMRGGMHALNPSHIDWGEGSKTS